MKKVFQTYSKITVFVLLIILLALVYNIKNELFFVKLEAFSTAAIFLLAVLGLEQVMVAKDDLRIRLLRESMSMAIEQAVIFAKETIPSGEEVYDLISREGMLKRGTNLNNLYTEDIIDNKEMLGHYMKVTAWFNSTDKENKEKILNFTNHLESISLLFVNGIADEKVVFPSMAETFCGYVENLYFVFALYRSKNRRSLYEATIKLYKTWANRIESESLVKQNQDIIQETPEIRNKTLPVIGV